MGFRCKLCGSYCMDSELLTYHNNVWHEGKQSHYDVEKRSL